MHSHKTSFHGVRELVAQFEKLMFSLQRHGAVDWTHIKIKQNAINTTDFRDLHKPKTALQFKYPCSIILY